MNDKKYLVSDLDGTLIPWEGANRLGRFQSLIELKGKLEEYSLGFIILTGRSLPNIFQALDDYPLPEPELIFSSAGSILYKRKSDEWVPCAEHGSYLEKKNPRWDRDAILTRLETIENLKYQAEIHQGRYKISFYLHTLDYRPVLKEAERLLGNLLETLSMQIYPEPELGWCYLDIMAKEADKKGALTYLSAHEIHAPYVFAGDNWNDRSAFLSDHPSILVKNTPEELKQETILKSPGQYIAVGEGRDGRFADGVMEGLEHMGWIK